MYPTMMPPIAAPETPTLPPPAFLAGVTPAVLALLGITDHDLFAAALPGETSGERAARLAAAADILDDRLAEIAAETLTPDVVRGWAL